MELQRMILNKECGTYYWEVNFQSLIKRSLTGKEYNSIEDKLDKLLEEMIE